MVQTRSQLEHLSKGKLIDELMSVEDISSKLANQRLDLTILLEDLKIVEDSIL